jgi:hypothetical protein
MSSPITAKPFIAFLSVSNDDAIIYISLLNLSTSYNKKVVNEGNNPSLDVIKSSLKAPSLVKSSGNSDSILVASSSII